MQEIFAISRPHPSLMKLYLLRSLIFPPVTIFALPYLFFRYKTLRYHFDHEGVQASWGILFRRQISLSYARIQDIHLASGILQRWLGLADIHIQTASGKAEAEMTIEGLLNYEDIRNFLYSKMRGVNMDGETTAQLDDDTSTGSGDIASALRQVTDELAATRRAVERLATSTHAEPTRAEPS